MKPLDRILAATDWKTRQAKRALPTCWYSAAEERRRQLHQLVTTAGLAPGAYAALVRHGDASQQIVAQEQEQDCDPIIVGKHGMHLAEEFLLGSVTKHVLAESQCDALVVSDGRAPLEASSGVQRK